MAKRNDISLPEGHLEALQDKLYAIPTSQQQTAPRGIRRLAPYLAYAASLAVLVLMGNFILRLSSSPQEEEEPLDYYSYLAQSLDPDGALELTEEEDLTSEEIVNYLLASNISVEHLNALYYEEDY